MTGSFSEQDAQLTIAPGLIDFAPGHPAAALLPAAELARAAAEALSRQGPSALAYGRNEGPASLIAPLTAWLAQHDDPLPPRHAMFITGGISQGLDLLCTLYTRPGDVILVESPVYHLALRIFRDHALDLVGVAADGEGLCVDALRTALTALRRDGRRARLLYTVPTFNNPAGHTLSAARRREIAALTAEAGVTILEDDVYRHLWYDAPPPPPIQALAPVGGVIRLGSFSKLVAPGLRLGWLIAEDAVVQRLTDSGLLDSGGGQSHTMAHIAGAFIRLGLLDGQVERLRDEYHRRRDVLFSALRSEMGAGCAWSEPSGGFFVWLTLPEGLDSATLLPLAEAAGVSYAPGPRFCCCGGCEQSLRLAFSLLATDELVEGVRRLARVVREGHDKPYDN